MQPASNFSVTEQTEDNVIITAILNGQRHAMNVLVEKHKQYACSLALRILHDSQLAEEVAHDSFVKALQSLSGFKKEAKFTTWLYRIVVNMAISKKRKLKMHFEDIDNTSELDLNYSEASTHLEKEDRTHYLNQALQHLNEIDSTLITLFYFEDATIEEMAAITGYDTNNTKVKLFRARKKLAVQLQMILKEETTSLI